MQFFERTTRAYDEKEESYLKALDATPTLDLTRPTIIHLPGFKSVDGCNLDQIEMNTRIIETHLGGVQLYEHKTKPQFLTLTYSPNNLKDLRKDEQSSLVSLLKLGKKEVLTASRSIQTSAYRDKPDYVSEDAKRFVKDVIVPAIHGHEGFDDIHTLTNKLAHLTFYSNSYGSVFAHEVETELTNTLMLSDKFTPRELKQALSHVVNIAAPNVSHTQTPRNFTHILFEGRDDPYRMFVQTKQELALTGEKRTDAVDMLGKKDPLEQASRAAVVLDEPDENLTMKAHGNIAQIIFTPPIEIHLPTREFIFAGQPGSQDGKIHDEDHHDTRLYTIPCDFPIGIGKQAPTIGKLYGRAVCNAVLRCERNITADFAGHPMSLLAHISTKLDGSGRVDADVSAAIGIRPPSATIHQISEHLAPPQRAIEEPKTIR